MRPGSNPGLGVKLPIILATLIALSTLTPTYAEGGAPTIKVYKPPIDPGKVVRFYWVETGCPWREDYVKLFDEVLLDFQQTALRFAENHPQYRRLTEIRLSLTKSPRQADIPIKTVEDLGERVWAQVVIGQSIEVLVRCSMIEETDPDHAYSVLFHELLHVLGVGHAFQDWTEGGEPELMAYTPRGVRVYPSTLDLAAVHRALFGNPRDFENFTLPQGLEYRVVKPYRVELQALGEELSEARGRLSEALERVGVLEAENEALRERLGNVTAEVEALRRENEELKARVGALQEELSRLADTLSEIDLLVTRVDKLSERFNDLVVRVGSVNASLSQMSLTVSGLGSRVSSLESRLGSLERQLQFANLVILALIAALAVLAASHFLKQRGG